MTLTSVPPRRSGAAAVVHRRVAAAEHDDALSDLRDVAERDRRQPVDADVDVRGGFRAPGNRQVASARRAGADEDGVPFLAEQRLQRFDARIAAELDAEPQHVAGLLVDHFLGQAELVESGEPDHAAGVRLRAVEHHDLVAERRETARHRERGRTGADAGDALAVARRDEPRQLVGDVVLVVGGDALQATDRDRLGFFGLRFLDAAAATRGLARPIARAAEDPREHVRLPVDHVGVGITTCRDQADVFGDRGVSRASPLAVDHLVEVVGIVDVCRLQRVLSRVPAARGGTLRVRKLQPVDRKPSPGAPPSGLSQGLCGSAGAAAISAQKPLLEFAIETPWERLWRASSRRFWEASSGLGSATASARVPEPRSAGSSAGRFASSASCKP